MNEHGHNTDPTPPGPGATGETPSSHAVPSRRRRLRMVTAAVTVGAVALGGGMIGRAVLGGSAPSTTSSTTAAGQFGHNGWPGTGGSSGDSTGAGSGSTATRAATSAEEAGVVDITTVLDYGAGAAAGTGIVLSPSGEILTNNHVIEGATRITVTVVSTGASYTASLVGADPTDDVAVLHLTGASGLTTATLGDAATVSVGDAVTAVGNAGGAGGTPTAATGTVMALDKAITAGDRTGANPEQLSGLFEVSAAVKAGDSGGPLYADAAVIGIDTAASGSTPSFDTTAASRGGSAGTVGYAIPIQTAIAIAARITSGEQSSTIQQGYPAFLGIELATSGSATGGVPISGVVPGSPAAALGLQTGDTITAVDTAPVSNAAALSATLAAHRPSDRVHVTWNDSTGSSHTADVALTTGPAQ